MICNKKINEIKKGLEMDLARYNGRMHSIDIHLPYEHAYELYQLLNNIETFRIKQIVPDYIFMQPDAEDFIKWIKEDMVVDLAKELCQQNTIKISKNENEIYEAELLVVRPFNGKVYGE